jgi:hypothetical protein
MKGLFGGTPVWQSSEFLMMLSNLEPSLIILVTDLKLCDEILPASRSAFTVVRSTPWIGLVHITNSILQSVQISPSPSGPLLVYPEDHKGSS